MVEEFYKFLRKTSFVLTFLFILFVQALHAASSGTVKGGIFDKQTKDPLPGATIVVKNTSIGAASDLNGNYTIYNVPSGEQTMTISYVGYNQLTVQVNVPESGEVERDFYLEPTTITGQTVVVTAQAQGQMQAINQQLSSNSIVNVVSAAKIQELPDFNAAEAIGRLPGVSTLRSSGEASKIVIRGIAPQYNLVAVNGIDLGATGNGGGVQLNPSAPVNPTQDRSVDLTMITPLMLQSVEVYKSLTPDMEADAIGGYVNMQLREAPSGLHTDLLWQSGYVNKTKTYNNYKALGAVSDRFLDDNLGAYFLLNVERYDRSDDNFYAQYQNLSATKDSITGYAPVEVTSIQLRRHIETRSRYGGNLILDYKLPAGSLTAINMFTRLNSDGTDYTTNYGTASGQSKNLNFNLSSGNGNTDQMTNALQGKYDFGFMSMDLGAANTYSRNYIPHQYTFTVTEEGAISGQINQNTLPENIVPRAQYIDSLTYLQFLGDGNYDFKENDQTYSGNFKIPFNLASSVSGFLKFGGKFRYNHRVNDQNLPYAQVFYGGSQFLVDSMHAQPQFNNLKLVLTGHSITTFLGSDFTNSDQGLARDFLNDKFGDLIWVPASSTLQGMVNYIEGVPALLNPLGNGWVSGLYQNEINDYANYERYYGAYAMSELDLGPNLMIVGGARFEQDNTQFTAYRMRSSGNIINQQVDTVTFYPKNRYWLPMVQGKYEIADWVDFRYSYTQTLARPDFTATAPYFNEDQNGTNINAGNPNLVPAQSYNHDAQIAFHNSEIGLLTLGGFYKTIRNFSYFVGGYRLVADSLLPANYPSGWPTMGQYARYNGSSSATINTWENNPYKAFVKGLEGDFQTRLWYLPVPFDGIVIGINYTHIWSNTYYPYVFNRNVTFPGQRRPTTVVIDSSRSGQLIDQPADIVNASLGYDYKGFSARLSFLYQGKMLTGIGALPEGDGIEEPYFRMDATVRQTLPVTGLQLFFDVNNINSRADISLQRSIGGFTSEQYYGLTADLGVRYTM